MNRKSISFECNLLLDFFKKSQINVYFLISFIFLLLNYFSNFPSLFLKAELFAETGSNFLKNALTLNWVDNFFITDSGYYPIFQRLIAVLMVKVFGIINLYPYIIQFIGFSFIAFASSIFCLNIFRNIIKSDLVRFLFSVIIGLHWGYEMYVFHNFTYYGVILALLILYVDIEKLKKITYFISFLILTLTIFTKPSFVIFLPIYIYKAITSVFYKQIKSAYLYITSSFLLFIELAILFNHRSVFINDMPIVGGISDLFIKIIYFYFYSFENLIVGKYIPNDSYISSCIAVFIILISLIALIINRYLNKDKNTIYNFLFLNLLAIMNFAFTVVALYKQPIDVFIVPTFYEDRRFFFSFIFLFFAIILLITKSIKNVKIQIILLLIIGYTSNVFGFVNAKDPYYPENNIAGHKILNAINAENKYSASQWLIYKNLLNDNSYCLPINPFGWYVMNNCSIINGLPWLDTSNQVGLMTSINILQERYLKNNLKIKAIHINNIEGYKDILIKINDINGMENIIKSITPVSSIYKYFKFDENIQIQKINFLNENMETIQLNTSNINILGSYTD